MSSSVARLTSACACGAIFSVDAPEAKDILAGQEAYLAAGWGYDERGYCRCPKCLSAPPPQVSGAVNAPEQGRLF